MKLDLSKLKNLGIKNVVIAALVLANVGQAGVLLMGGGDTANYAAGVSGQPQNSRVITRNFTGEVVAIADGRDILEQEIRERLNFITGGRGDKIDLNKMDANGLEAVAREAAVQRKILEEVYAAGTQNDPELQNRIDDLVENIYKEKYLENIAKSGVTEEKLKTLYDDLVSKAKNSKQYKVRHILVRTEGEAKQVLEKLKTQRFEDLAKAVSVDKQSAVRGGDLGYIFPEEFVVEFSDAVKKLGKGQTSGVVKSEFGYHIIRMEDSKNAEIISFDKAKPRIEKQLGSEAVKNYIEELAKKIVLQVVKTPAPDAVGNSASAPVAPAGVAAPQGQAPAAPVAPTAPASAEPTLNPDEVKN